MLINVKGRLELILQMINDAEEIAGSLSLKVGRPCPEELLAALSATKTAAAKLLKNED